MGAYVNPSNRGFKETLNSECYIDKSGLIGFVNSKLFTKEKETSFTRPRRFGKTTACNMLAAYYSKGCDSSDLFKGLEIERDPSYHEHLNKHPVIYFDLFPFMYEWSSGKLKDQTMVQYLESTLVEELAKEYPGVINKNVYTLNQAMFDIASLPLTKEEEKNHESHQFIVIIDEWDMVLREAKDDEKMIEEYINFLRSIFRSKNTSDYLAGAYMTGILPIIRYDTQSALSDFKEFTMLKPKQLAKYVGFTSEDILTVCRKYNADPKRMKEWYDGYSFPDVGEVYCPSSVMTAAMDKDYSSHWPKTSAMESLTCYIYANYAGLKEAMNDLLDGREVKVNTDTFENRLDKVETRDKILTVLVHLGYLAFNLASKCVRIPNNEVRLQMLEAFAQSPSKEFFRRIERCEKVIEATKAMDAKTVASLISEIHDDRPPIHYNDENALRYIVLMAYNNSPSAEYVKFEELSSSKGFVDILFRPEPLDNAPAILIELKYNRSAKAALQQIYDKNYLAYLKKDNYHGGVLLVGVNYSARTRKHTCKIEKATI